MNNSTDWLLFAENDLKTAKAAFGEGITNNACFHAHQTVEKCLKAIVLVKEQEVPKTHDLLFLLEKATVHHSQLTKFSQHCQFLNQFYISTRYPDALPVSGAESLPTSEDSRQAIAYAEEVLTAVRSLTVREKQFGFTTPLVIAIGALVIAIIAGVVGYSLKSNPKPSSTPTSTSQFTTQATPTDETANWKTYFSQTGKFTLKYPREWNMGSAGSLATGTELVTFAPEGPPEDVKPFLTVSFQRPDTSTGIIDAKTFMDAWTRSNRQDMPGLKVTNTSLVGREAFKIEFEWDPGRYARGRFKSVWLITDNGGLIYHLSSMLIEPFDMQMQTLDQILSTFKFL